MYHADRDKGKCDLHGERDPRRCHHQILQCLAIGRRDCEFTYSPWFRERKTRKRGVPSGASFFCVDPDFDDVALLHNKSNVRVLATVPWFYSAMTYPWYPASVIVHDISVANFPSQ